MKSKIAALSLLFVVVASSGCGALGIRHFEVWDGGPSMDFYAGTDIHLGANAVDKIDDNRSIDGADDRYYEPRVLKTKRSASPRGTPAPDYD